MRTILIFAFSAACLSAQVTIDNPYAYPARPTVTGITVVGNAVTAVSIAAGTTCPAAIPEVVFIPLNEAGHGATGTVQCSGTYTGITVTAGGALYTNGSPAGGTGAAAPTIMAAFNLPFNVPFVYHTHDAETGGSAPLAKMLCAYSCANYGGGSVVDKNHFQNGVPTSDPGSTYTTVGNAGCPVYTPTTYTLLSATAGTPIHVTITGITIPMVNLTPITITGAVGGMTNLNTASAALGGTYYVQNVTNDGTNTSADLYSWVANGSGVRSLAAITGAGSYTDSGVVTIAGCNVTYPGTPGHAFTFVRGVEGIGADPSFPGPFNSLVAGNGHHFTLTNYGGTTTEQATNANNHRASMIAALATVSPGGAFVEFSHPTFPLSGWTTEQMVRTAKSLPTALAQGRVHMSSTSGQSDAVQAAVWPQRICQGSIEDAYASTTINAVRNNIFVSSLPPTVSDMMASMTGSCNFFMSAQSAAIFGAIRCGVSGKTIACASFQGEPAALATGQNSRTWMWVVDGIMAKVVNSSATIWSSFYTITGKELQVSVTLLGSSFTSGYYPVGARTDIPWAGVSENNPIVSSQSFIVLNTTGRAAATVGMRSGGMVIR